MTWVDPHLVTWGELPTLTITTPGICINVDQISIRHKNVGSIYLIDINHCYPVLGWQRNCFCPLQWRHNGHDGVSNHQPHNCLLSRLFRCRSKKTLKLRVTGLCVGNSPWTGEFPAQMASNAEKVSIWWRHHGPRMWVYAIWAPVLIRQRGCWCPCTLIVESTSATTMMTWAGDDTGHYKFYSWRKLHPPCWLT